MCSKLQLGTQVLQEPLYALLSDQQAAWGPLAWGTGAQAGSEQEGDKSEVQLVGPDDVQAQRFLREYVDRAVGRVGKEEGVAV
jgi:hypothetical protein